MKDHVHLLHAIVLGSGAKRVLEIGTRRGESTMAILSALPPDGHLDSVDIDDCPVAEERVAHAGLSDRWTFHKQSSEEYLKSARGEYDIIFLDGDHEEVTVHMELFYVKYFLGKNGILLAHDPMSWPGVMNAFKLNCPWPFVMLPYGHGMYISVRTS